MPATSPVSFRFSPEVKALLEQAAALDNRSQANFLENLIRTYCASHSVTVAGATPSKSGNTQSKKGHS